MKTANKFSGLKAAIDALQNSRDLSLSALVDRRSFLIDEVARHLSPNDMEEFNRAMGITKLPPEVPILERLSDKEVRELLRSWVSSH